MKNVLWVPTPFLPGDFPGAKGKPGFPYRTPLFPSSPLGLVPHLVCPHLPLSPIESDPGSKLNIFISPSLLYNTSWVFLSTLVGLDEQISLWLSTACGAESRSVQGVAWWTTRDLGKAARPISPTCENFSWACASY